jgi:NADH dehydrogenase
MTGARIVVVGGGFAGTQLVKSLKGKLPPGASLTLVSDESYTCFNPMLPEVVGDGAEPVLVAGATVITSIGTRANPLIESCGLASERGRIETDSDFRVQAVAGVWALGDCAQVINRLDGQASPPTAQFAVRQAKICARNLLAHLAARPLEDFSYRARGMMASVGRRRGVARVFGVHLAGLPAWMLWRAYYLLQMPTLGRKVRIFVEWTWGMFFPNDITHLRFTRSHELDRD